MNFQDFLSLIRSGGADGGNPVSKLFAVLMKEDHTLPFPLMITAYRRKMLINATMSSSGPEKRYVGSESLPRCPCWCPFVPQNNFQRASFVSTVADWDRTYSAHWCAQETSGLLLASMVGGHHSLKYPVPPPTRQSPGTRDSVQSSCPGCSKRSPVATNAK